MESTFFAKGIEFFNFKQSKSQILSSFYDFQKVWLFFKSKKQSALKKPEFQNLFSSKNPIWQPW